MKKTLLLFFIFFSIQGFSQNWKLLVEDKTYFYKHIDSLYITNTIKIDSTNNSTTDSIFNISTTIKVCDTCTIIPPEADGGVLYHAYSPEIFGYAPYYSVTNNHHNFDNNIIEQNSQLNDSWVFNSTSGITATIVDIDEIAIFGNLDSIKVIELSTLDTLILSKNHGVIRYPDFENAGKYFLLTGYHEGQNSFGEYLPNMWRIYDFNVDDIFCFRNELYYDGLWEYHYRNVKIKILEDLSTVSEVSYRLKIYISTTTQIGLIENAYYTYSSTNYIDTFKINSSNSYLENSYSGLCSSLDTWGYQRTFYKYPFISNEILSSGFGGGVEYSNVYHTFDSVLGYRKKFSPMTIDSDSLAYFHNNFYYPGYDIFTEGLGRDSLDFYDFETGGINYLSGYIKNGDTTGTIYNFPEDLGMENSETIPLNIYPNPATNQIHIPGNLQLISFYSLTGELVLQIQKPYQTIYIDYLPAGIYFVHAFDLDGNRMETKLVISR